MNMLNTLFKMLRRFYLFACLAFMSAPAFAGPVYTLPAHRQVVFDDNYTITNGVTIWTRNGSDTSEGSKFGTNHFYRANGQTNLSLQAYVRWSFLNFRLGRLNPATILSVPPLVNNNTFSSTGGTNWCGYFRNTDRAIVESPVFTNGIGKIYFDMILGKEVTIWPIIKISIATNILDAGSIVYPIPADAWEQIDSIELTDTQLVQRVIQINNASPMAIRLERTTVNGASLDDAFVAIDNIRVSEPPADVIMDKGLTPFNAYPSVNTNMNVQFRIDNVPGPNTTKAVTRTNVLLVSRWNYLNQKTSAWVTNKMYCVDLGDNAGNSELWQPTNTPMRVYADAGDLEYYFLCYFNGTYYQSYDYTVNPPVLKPALFPAENQSPRLYSAAGLTDLSGTPTNHFIFPLRLFPSSHYTLTTMLSVNGQPPSPLSMTLVGTNKWQAKCKVVGTDTTNLLWFFEATGAYTNAAAFATTSEKTYWENTSQSRIQNGSLPYGDNCGLTDASITNRLEDWFGVNVTPGESSYVLFTLDTAKTNYLAGRGEYQNFNAWNTGATAQNYFTDVDDKEPKTSYSQNFSSGWKPSVFLARSNWFFKDVAYTATETSAIRVGPENILDAVDWNAGSFQYAVERTPGNTKPDYSGTASQRRNQAVRLLGGSQSLGLGYYQGNANQQTAINGVGVVTYKARLSRPIATDPEYNINVGWRMTDMRRTNYVISTSMNATIGNVSPEKPSMSVIVYYQNMFKFYEYRITQEPDSRDMGTGTSVVAGWDKRIRHEIWKWDGTRTPKLLASLVHTLTTADGTWDAKLTDTFTSYQTFVNVYNSSSTATRLKVKFNQTDITGWALSNGATAIGAVVEDANTPLSYGTYGFHSADCAIWVPGMWIENLDSFGNTILGGLVPVLGTPSEWYIAPGIYKTSTGFMSETQSTTVKVLTGTSELGPWTPFITNSVTSYAYQSFTNSPKAWSNLCAKIQANDMIGVAIDGVRVESWRGETITSTPSDNWKITEGWVSSNITDKCFAHLDASQADPSKIQGVRSERIVGIGSLTFDYRVLAAPAQIKIQYTVNTFPPDDSNAGWTDITNLTFATAPGVWTNANYYLALAPATNLYVRIINNIVTNRKASVDLKNIVIWNNPTNSPNDWAAYNMKISDNETDKWWLDKKTVSGTDDDKARSGYMNNSTNNTIPTRPMTMFNPYIMAPRLTRGLGTISFLARAFTTDYAAGNTNTTISVYATTDEWNKEKLDATWTKYYTFTNITNGFYRPFVYNHPTVPNDIKAVKLVVQGVIPPYSGTPQRVCLDEIVVSEAIYPRFDITSVKLILPGAIETKQPLEGEDIGLQAELTNVLMDPANIKVYVTYVLGTNTWGVTNAPISKQVTKVMPKSSGRIYRTLGNFMTTGIPEQGKYNVVQYLVWATYDGNGVHTNYQSASTADHFNTPSWYYPVDFNKQGNIAAGEPKDTWSPYYITYDVPPGSVWINELNLNENSEAIGPRVFLNPYIEIAQPSWMDLTGWNVEILDLYYAPRLSFSILSPSSITPVLGANGYSLFVVGPYDFEATSYPALSTTTTVHQSVQNIRGGAGVSLYPGGFRLKRPMGMYEHAIAYDWDRNTIPWVTGDNFVDNEVPQTPFKYVGREYDNGSLSYTGTVNVAFGQYSRTDTTNTWAPGFANYNWTPGRINVGQTFPYAPTPGGSNVLITSTFESPDSQMHGWQNNIRQNPLQFKLKKGTGTNFLYVADSWFRFYGITSNTVQLLSPGQRQTITNYTVALNNVQTNITLVSDIRLAPHVIDFVTTPEMIAWLQQFGDKPLAPSYYGTATLSILDEYWLDIDPTQTNRLIFRNKTPAPDPSGLWLTLEMATINGYGVTNRLTHLLGDAMVSIWAKDNLAEPFRPYGQYWISEQSFDSNYWARTRLNAYTNISASFEWRLNVNDQRLATNELINITGP